GPLLVDAIAQFLEHPSPAGLCPGQVGHPEFDVVQHPRASEIHSDSMPGPRPARDPDAPLFSQVRPMYAAKAPAQEAVSTLRWSLFMPLSHRSGSPARPAYIRATSGRGRMRNRPSAIPTITASATASGVMAESLRISFSAGDAPAIIGVLTPCGQIACTVMPRWA